jgi:hypothetical protein
MRLAMAAAVVLLAASAGCRRLVGPQYEYEEQLYLSGDLSAIVVVNTSLPALVALRGVDVNVAPGARTTAAEIRSLFESGGCQVDRVGQGWRRAGRRFVQVRLSAPDVRTLATCMPLAWSRYAVEREGGVMRYRQLVGAAAGADAGAVNWDGTELVAFRLHLPSRITYHNVKLLDGTNGEVERGNILTWEQRLTDRRAGVPIEMDVRMEGETILYRTLIVFGSTFLAALIALALVVWWLKRRGRAATLGRSA